MKILTWFRSLSVDIALGSVVMTNSLAKTQGIKLPLSISLALFFAVWFIYTLDHWLDAKRLGQQATMHRHQLHDRYNKPLFYLMIIEVIGGLISCYWLPAQSFYLGAIVGVSVVLYFLFSVIFHIVLIKEVLIASIYAVGVLVGPLSIGSNASMVNLLYLLIIFGLALVNLIIIAMYEISHDIKDDTPSWPIRFGYKSSYFLVICILYGLLILIGFCGYWAGSSLVLQGSFFVMAIVLNVIVRHPRFFRKHERYRIFADLIFFIPGITLLY